MVPEPPELEDLYDDITLRRMGVHAGPGCPRPVDRAASELPDVEIPDVEVPDVEAPGCGVPDFEIADCERPEPGREPGVADSSAGRGSEVGGVAPSISAPNRVVPRRSGRPLSSLMIAAAMSGVGEVIEPENRKAAMVELDPGLARFDDRPVEFFHVPGCPKASRIVLRSWLRSDRRRSP